MREYLKDGKLRNLSLLFLALIICAGALIIVLSVSRSELDGLKAQHKDMIMLMDEFEALKAKLDSVEKRKSLSKISGVMPAVDEVFSSIGLKGRIKTIKSLGNKEISGGSEETAEVSVEKLSMNETVNLFHKIENAPMLLILKKAEIKTSFEKPDLLNLNLTVSFMHEK